MSGENIPTARSIAEAYLDDLAYIHDSGFGTLARDAATRFMDELEGFGHADGTVVDLGCGSGILASALIDAGYNVLGIDVSDAMIALARMRAPQAELRLGSFVSADLPPSVAVTAIGQETTLEAGAPVLTRTIASFRQVGTSYRRDDEVHRLVLMDPAVVRRSLQSVGFEVRTILRYNAVRGTGGTDAYGVGESEDSAADRQRAITASGARPPTAERLAPVKAAGGSRCAVP